MTYENGEVRPIAIGNTLRRLAGKITSQYIQENLGSYLRPVQLGYGIKGGCEASVHAVRSFLRTQSSMKVLLKVDFSNAFNSIKRSEILKRIKDRCPQAYYYSYQSYAYETNLYYQNEIIASATGVQQGDPMGPALFSLGVHELATNLSSLLNIWYLDDATVGGDASTVLDDFRTLIRESGRLGLSLNRDKCELILVNPDERAESVINSFKAVAPEIHHTSVEEVTLLGAPLLDTAVPEAFFHKMEVMRVLVGRLKFLGAHEALYILKNCLALPKLLYILRAAPCWKYDVELERINNIIQESLQEIMSLKCTKNSLIQAALPVSKGGLGLRDPSVVALPAYLSSFFSTRELAQEIYSVPSESVPADVEAAMALWTLTSRQAASELTDEARGSQRAWDSPLVEQTFRELLKKSTNMETRARLLGTASRESGAWLHAIPAASIGTRMDDHAVRLSVAQRIGSEVCMKFKCVCGAEVDKFARHPLHCKRSFGRRPRHEEVNSIISRSLTSAGFPSVLEPVGVCRADGKRPDGLSLFPWERGFSLAWDSTCVDTLAPSNVSHSAGEPGRAATCAEAAKTGKYRELEGRVVFMPLGFETLGAWGAKCVVFIKRLGGLIASKTGERRSTTFLFQRLSIAIQRGNAASILGAIPYSGSLEEIFNIP